MEKYYSITQIEKIDFETPKSHITECETLNEAKNFLLTDIVVIKKDLPSRNAIGSGFIYPYVYSYKIIDKKEIPFLLSYKNNKLTDFIIETFRSAYYDDEGWGEISILDKNNIPKTVRIKAGFNDSAIFVINIMKFLFTFEIEYNSNWKFYDLLTEKLENIEELEKENSGLKEKLEETSLKLKATKKNKLNPTKGTTPKKSTG